jgi:glutaredoxin
MNTIQLLALSVTVLASVLATPASAQYRWTDASGKVHYGDSPPRDAKDVRPLGQRAVPSGAGGDATVGLPYEVRRAMERAPVVLYTSPECPPCAPAAALLRERGVPFAERSVRSPDDLQEFRRISGGLRLPYLTVGSQSQSGFEPDAWLSLLDAAGYPKGSMLPRSYQWPAAQPLVPPAKPEGKPTDAAAEAPAPATPAAKR